MALHSISDGITRRTLDGKNQDGSHCGDHIIISGTGRAGTTFLVQYLTAIGFDTGYSIEEALTAVDEISFAGLEQNYYARKFPYVVKSPYLTDHLGTLLAQRRMRVAYAIIPMRDLFGAAQSRRRVYWELAARGLNPLKHFGTIWKTKNPNNQESALAIQLYKIIVTLAQYDVPTQFLIYPDFVKAHDTLYACLGHILSLHGVSREESLQAYQRVVQLHLIHDFSE